MAFHGHFMALNGFQWLSFFSTAPSSTYVLLMALMFLTVGFHSLAETLGTNDGALGLLTLGVDTGFVVGAVKLLDGVQLDAVGSKLNDAALALSFDMTVDIKPDELTARSSSEIEQKVGGPTFHGSEKKGEKNTGNKTSGQSTDLKHQAPSPTTLNALDFAYTVIS